MYREARTAGEAISGMEASHHLSATLYFGISALEAFLNQQMRRHLRQAGKTDEEILEALRYGPDFKKRLKKWPKEIVGSAVTLRDGTLQKLHSYNEIRGALTHPKHSDHRDYEPLETLDPMEVVDTVAEYISQFLLATGEPFHSWLWGWNYLNPGKDGHEISLLPATQIVHSMDALGFPFASRPRERDRNQRWRDENMRGYAAYSKVASFLGTLDHCEPKHLQFPHQPKLCRRWWDPAHHATCGYVTQEALQAAIDYNPFEMARMEAEIDEFKRKGRLRRAGEVIRFFLTGE